jgi:hypothetical protein
MQGGCQSSLQMSTNRHTLKYACNFCSDTVKIKRFSCNGLSQAMKHRWITMNLQANIEALRGNTYHHPGPRNSKVCHLPPKWCWHCPRALLGPSLSTTRIVNRRSKVHSTVLCLKRRL